MQKVLNTLSLWKHNMNVSIIIVNYNTKQLLADCLNSIYEQTKDISFEVIVSDNGSTDGSIKMLKQDFPQVILIENNANLGFGAANNRGLTIAKGKYIFYLNSDTVLQNNAVKLFFDFFEEHGEEYNLGTIGSNLLDANGNIGPSYGYFSTNLHRLKIALVDFLRIYKAFIKSKILKKQLTENAISPVSQNFTKSAYIGYVDYVIGADMFLKNDGLAKFDEDFFMYIEEVHLQYNMKKNKKNNYIINTPKIIHLEGASSKKQDSVTLIDFYTSFSKLNNMISTITFVKKNSNNIVIIFLLKFLTFLTMTNPLIQTKTKEYVKKIWL